MAGIHKYFSLEELLPVYYPGIKDELELFTDREEFEKFSQDDLPAKQHVLKVDFRPYDTRYFNYNQSDSSLAEHLRNSIAGPNILLTVTRNEKANIPASAFLTRNPATASFLSEEKNSIFFPLYLHEGNQSGKELISKKQNLNDDIINRFSSHLGMAFVPDTVTPGNVCMAANSDVRSEFRITFSALDVLDYIYAAVFSGSLKSSDEGFPLIPYPDNTDLFWKIVSYGSILRETHLLERYMPKDSMPGFPVEGVNRITRHVTLTSIEPVTSSHGRVRINNNQFFTGIPLKAWDCQIGNYKPANLWLANRSGSVMRQKDIQHYQTLIAALSESNRILQEVRQFSF